MIEDATSANCTLSQR